MQEYYSKSENDTITFAKRMAKLVEKPAIILLEGDLGAGKTHFVKGFAEGLKCKNMVTSPTFTLMNMYEGKKCDIYHFDLYRINSPEELENLGFDEYFDKKTLKGVSLVEWPEKAKGLTSEWDYKVTIIKDGDENERKITIEKRGEKC